MVTGESGVMAATGIIIIGIKPIMVTHGVTEAAMGGMPMIVITGVGTVVVGTMLVHTMVVGTKVADTLAAVIRLSMAVGIRVVVTAVAMPVVIMAAVTKVAVAMPVVGMAVVATKVKAIRHAEMNKENILAD